MSIPPPSPPPGQPPTHFPAPWASDWGEDRFGLWQGLTYRGARQGFRWIPPTPRPYLMGSPPDEHSRDDDETQHEVTLTRGFWLAETACTQALWQAVTGENPSHFKGERRPVENVSWDEVRGFRGRLNALLAAATLDHGSVRGGGPGVGLKPDLQPHTQPDSDAAEWGLRLPSEAEWEYACRARTPTPFSFGEDIDPGLANYNGNYPYRGNQNGLYREQTVEVASLPANPWGLYEMHGNVWEWCQDWYGPYPGGPVTDPTGPNRSERRVLRGGCWFNSGRDLRSASRVGSDPGGRYRRIGFRLALGPEPGQARQAA